MDEKKAIAEVEALKKQEEDEIIKLRKEKNDIEKKNATLTSKFQKEKEKYQKSVKEWN